MENKRFCVYRLFGMDVTPRKLYRKQIELLNINVWRLENQLKTSDASMKASTKDFEDLKKEPTDAHRETARLQAKLIEVQKSYDWAKRQLSKYERKRGSNGRFTKKEQSELPRSSTSLIV